MPTQVPTVTVGGVDRTNCIRIASLSIADTRSDIPASASFTVEGSRHWRPVVGQSVTAVLDSRTPFSGQTVGVAQRWEGHPNNVLFDCTCAGWGRWLDKNRVTARWVSTSASTIAEAIIDDWCDGLSHAHVVAALATVDELVAVDELPSALLTRLAEIVGGRWYLDEDKELHFWVTADTGVEQPDTLTEANCQYIMAATDWSQVATRVRAEGMTTTTPVHLCDTDTLFPVGGFNVVDPHSANGRTIANMTGFDAAGGAIRVTSAFGGTPIEMTYTALVDPGEHFAHATAQAGASSVAVSTSPIDESTYFESGGGWVITSGGQYVRYTGKSTGALTGVPTCQSITSCGIASGTYTCTVQTPAPHGWSAGDVITIFGVPTAGFNGTWRLTAITSNVTATFEIDDPTLATDSGGGWAGLQGCIATAIPAGTAIWPCRMLTGVSGAADLPASSSVRAVVVVSDATAISELAAMDGTDGVRETVLSADGDATAEELATRAAAELTIRQNAETRLSYTTTDPKTRAGGTVSASCYTPTFATEVAADSPLGYWKLGDTSGVVAVDASGHAHNLAYTGTPSLNQLGGLGNFDAAVLLDGSSQYAAAANTTDWNVGDVFSVEAVVKRTRANAYDMIVCKGQGAYRLSFWDDGCVHLRCPGVNGIVRSRWPIEVGRWYHLLATKTGATARMYVNGEDVSVGVAAATCADNGEYFHIGVSSYGGTYYFGGVVQHVALYGAALSAARVSAHYAASLKPPAITGDYYIQRVTMTNFGRADQAPPTRQVEASNRRFTVNQLWRKLQRG